MGCELGKLAAAEGKGDPFHRAPPAADPRSPLTAKQQYCMRASWKGIFRAIERTGIILFVKLFEENADLLHMFDKFVPLSALSREQRAASAELADHANKVMHTLDEGIKTLGDVDAFEQYVRHVGATHVRHEGFKADYFWRIEQPFLAAARATLGDRYTDNVELIYTLTIRYILENLVRGYEDAAAARE